ncbi:MAG: LexA family transcriptional regulator [Moraxella sp.]|nr:LexA family transcriptional regulator [Moraxella sp.]
MLHDRIQRKLDEKRLRQADIARATGKSTAAVTKWLSGQNIPKADSLVKIANLLGVTPEWLATGQGEMTAKPTVEELRQRIKAIENRKSEVEPSDFLSTNNSVPIISWVAAGSWSESNVVEWIDEDTEYLPRPANLSANGFCLQVRGVSMMPEFKPDEVIFVEPNFGVWDLKNGDLVVVRENGNHEATFKQLIMGETSADMYLKPLNPDWHEQRMTPKSEWELVGKVVGKWVRY